MKKIILDCLGGDNGMNATVAGAVSMLQKEKDIILVLVGDRDVIKPKLRDANTKDNIMNRVEIVHTVENIPLTEHPTEAVKNRPNSSICLGLEILKKDADCVAFVSAGSTGAVLTAGVLKIGRVQGLIRPALCPNLPTKLGITTMLIDCGANADCKPETLAHFALMGKVYKETEGMMLPKIGLLNIGTEETKGSALYQQTHRLLKKLGDAGLMNFAGNIEARNALDGEINVIVADGFTGNVLLKAIEGATNFAFGQVKSAFTNGGVGGKIAGGLVGGKLQELKQKFSGNEGGSIFLGLNKPIIKCHGNADAKTIASALKYALTVANMSLGDKIKTAVQRTEPHLMGALKELANPTPPTPATTPQATATAQVPPTVAQTQPTSQQPQAVPQPAPAQAQPTAQTQPTAPQPANAQQSGAQTPTATPQTTTAQAQTTATVQPVPPTTASQPTATPQPAQQPQPAPAITPQQAG
jgi:glycerol-3-phosphate acyltransferase PlsX